MSKKFFNFQKKQNKLTNKKKKRKKHFFDGSKNNNKNNTNTNNKSSSNTKEYSQNEKYKFNKSKNEFPQKSDHNPNFYKNKSKNDLTKITERMETNLEDSKFRILNEKLYKSSSKEASDYFKSNSEDFITYHKGFSTQAKKWPINPNDIILKSLLLPKYKETVIADIGCGEGKIGQKLVPLGYTVKSFDLVSLNEFVTVGDMKNLPIEKKSVDIAIYCLSLMNKNFIPFISECNRILRVGGRMLVVEISSRIVDNKKFCGVFEKYGFEEIKRKNLEGYFEMFTFRKIKDCKITKEDEELDNTYDILKPCIYKKR